MFHNGHIRSGDFSYLKLIRGNADFRYLWFGQIVSLLGDWFNLIACAALISKLTHSGVAVGGLFVVRMTAAFLVSPVAGVVADRYNRKRILIVADLVRGIIVLGFLWVREAGDVWVLYALTACQLGISGFFFPARNAILPSIVSAADLGAANALSSATWSVMLAFGTALGGLVAGGIGIYTAFFVDSFSFFLSAFLIARVGYTAVAERFGSGRRVGDAFRKYVEGLAYLRRHAHVLIVVLHKAALTLTTSGALQVIQVALAERRFVIGEGGGIGMGVMFAVVGLGTGIGPIVARRYTKDDAGSLRSAIAVGFGMIVLGVAVMACLTNFATVLLGILLRGVGGGIVWVFSTQLLMQMVPGDFRGRVFATEFALFTLMGAISAAATGWAIDQPALGVGGTLWVMVGLCLAPAILWAVCLGKGRLCPLSGDDGEMAE